MATWTQAQIDAASITRGDKITNGETGKGLCIRIEHASYEGVELCPTEAELAADCTDAQAKTYISTTLLAMEKVNKPVKDAHTDKGWGGKTVGELV